MKDVIFGPSVLVMDHARAEEDAGVTAEFRSRMAGLFESKRIAGLVSER